MLIGRFGLSLVKSLSVLVTLELFTIYNHYGGLALNSSKRRTKKFSGHTWSILWRWILFFF